LRAKKIIKFNNTLTNLAFLSFSQIILIKTTVIDVTVLLESFNLTALLKYFKVDNAKLKATETEITMLTQSLSHRKELLSKQG